MSWDRGWQDAWQEPAPAGAAQDERATAAVALTEGDIAALRSAAVSLERASRATGGCQNCRHLANDLTRAGDNLRRVIGKVGAGGATLWFEGRDT